MHCRMLLDLDMDNKKAGNKKAGKNQSHVELYGSVNRKAGLRKIQIPMSCPKKAWQGCV